MKTGLLKKTLLAFAASVLMFAYGAAEAHATWGSFGSRGGGSWGGSRGGGSSGGGSWGGSRGGLFSGHRMRSHGSSGGSSGGSRGGSFGGSSGGSYGGSRGGSFGGSSGGSSGGSRGRLFSGRLFKRHQAKRNARYGSSGGSRGGSSGGSSGGYSYYSGSRGGSSGGSVGRIQYSSPVTSYSVPTYSAPVQPAYGTPVYDSAVPSYPMDSYVPSTGVPYEGTVVPGQPTQAAPVDGTTPPPRPEANGAGDGTSTSTQGAKSSDTTAQLNLRIPAQAVVYVNNRKTTTPGSFRSYVSRNLKPGRKYTYEVRAEIEKNGKKLSRTKVVQLKAGSDKTFDMDFDQSEDKVTSVTLFVPEDAKVTLGGVKTNKQGAMRYFSTTSLKGDDSWKSYQVSVSVTRDGKTKTRNRVIDVNAGDSVNLRFDFDAGSQIASR